MLPLSAKAVYAICLHAWVMCSWLLPWCGMPLKGLGMQLLLDGGAAVQGWSPYHAYRRPLLLFFDLSKRMAP
jgi:hypothetical protein